jgi:hypothetical protein
MVVCEAEQGKASVVQGVAGIGNCDRILLVESLTLWGISLVVFCRYPWRLESAH